MKVLITGGAGFLGSHLADAFLARGDQVQVVDSGPGHKVRHNLGHSGFTLIQGSVMEESLMDSLILHADLVYHLAAVVGVEHYVANPYSVLNTNINGTQLVLRLAHKYGRKVVFSSTSEVYGRNPAVPWREDDDRILGSTGIDRWCYSTSKAVGEHFCHAYRKMGLDVVILRYFNVYGPRLDKLDAGRVVSIFMGQILRGEPVTVIGDGAQTRCFTFVSDAVEATLAAGLRDEAVGRIINVGHHQENSVLELATLMIELAASASELVFVPQERIYGASYEDVPRRIPDVSRMREILGVEARVSLREGMAETIRSFRQSPLRQDRL